MLKAIYTCRYACVNHDAHGDKVRNWYGHLSFYGWTTLNLSSALSNTTAATWYFLDMEKSPPQWGVTSLGRVEHREGSTLMAWKRILRVTVTVLWFVSS
jgi:hypothetical protein